MATDISSSSVSRGSLVLSITWLGCISESRCTFFPFEVKGTKPQVSSETFQYNLTNSNSTTFKISGLNGMKRER